ncbi:hypothetical protein E2C01_088174 [Portunus trituberculatus]|uniref:Uncharacterized protein n=1 Tax=Portunus trituberculatus TaxID=210409 RepID=A0A5B7JJ66_PORTR|nr:hypothetical protein [Portunus trituberculatus]
MTGIIYYLRASRSPQENELERGLSSAKASLLPGCHSERRHQVTERLEVLLLFSEEYRKKWHECVSMLLTRYFPTLAWEKRHLM